MAVPRLVVHRHAPLQRAGQRGHVQRRRCGHRLDLLRHVEQIAAVPARHGDHRLPRLRLQRQGMAQMGLRPVQQALQRGLVQTVQHEHLATGQQGAVQFEGRVLRRGAHQCDGAVLHHWEEAVLLAAVEAVDLVAEQQRPSSRLPPAPGGVPQLAQIRNAALDGADRLEMQVRLLGQEARDGGLAGAGRTPQHHGGQRPRRDHAAQRGVGGEQVILPNDIGHGLGPQPVRQRADTLAGEQRRPRHGVGLRYGGGAGGPLLHRGEALPRLVLQGEQHVAQGQGRQRRAPRTPPARRHCRWGGWTARRSARASAACRTG